MLTIAVSSRSLFHLEEANAIFERDGQAAYDGFMLASRRAPLAPGAAFALVSKLLKLNTPGERDRVEVVLLSRNSAGSSARIMHSVEHHGLDIERAVFTAGGDRFRYAQQYGADLFLSATGVDTGQAVKNGIAAATIVPSASVRREAHDTTIRFAFDGDAVLFSDESDAVFRGGGLQKFIEHEKSNEHVILGDGPFRRLVHKLADLRSSLPRDERGKTALRIGLVTARSLQCSPRVLNTLIEWGLELDELVFAGGAPKGPLLKAMGPDIFFDDTVHNVRSALEHDVVAAQVPFGAGGLAMLQSPSPAGAPPRRAQQADPDPDLPAHSPVEPARRIPRPR